MLYQYITLRCESRAWPGVIEAVHGPVKYRVTSDNGVVFGLWAGEIGFYANEGVLVVAHSDPDFEVGPIDGVTEMDVELVESTARPETSDPVTADGVYAHRWFDLDEASWPEFLELSSTAWPFFEAAHEGVHIVGFWKSVQVAAPDARVVLVTRYPDLAEWERSRGYRGELGSDAHEAWTRFLRRHTLTNRTIVRTARLVH